MTPQHPKLATGRQWATVSLASFADVPDILPVPFKAFVLLLAADARSLSHEALLHRCRQFLKAGARFVCTWGPDSSRVHDTFDEAAQGLGLNAANRVIMTTWHDRESITKATWFAANAAFPDAAYEDASEALVAVTIGVTEWDAQVKEYLAAGTPLEDEA